MPDPEPFIKCIVSGLVAGLSHPAVMHLKRNNSLILLQNRMNFFFSCVTQSEKCSITCLPLFHAFAIIKLLSFKNNKQHKSVINIIHTSYSKSSEFMQ